MPLKVAFARELSCPATKSDAVWADADWADLADLADAKSASAYTYTPNPAFASTCAPPSFDIQ